MQTMPISAMATHLVLSHNHLSSDHLTPTWFHADNAHQRNRRPPCRRRLRRIQRNIGESGLAQDVSSTKCASLIVVEKERQKHMTDRRLLTVYVTISAQRAPFTSLFTLKRRRLSHRLSQWSNVSR